jgi:quercetin dioxygenase-like cupin family protein
MPLEGAARRGKTPQSIAKYPDTVSVQHWNSTLDGPLSETAMRQKLEAEGYLVARYAYPPGTHFPEHTHDVDKIDAVVSGRFRLVIGGHPVVLGPGDRVTVPRGIRHSATVLGSETVISLDAMKRP